MASRFHEPASVIDDRIGSDRIVALTREWRSFANELTVGWHGQRRSWREHTGGDGFLDEVQLVQRTVFPLFASRFLSFDVGENLSPEESGDEGKPDFTPADPVTHPFVFETKSSNRGVNLDDADDLDQVLRYLTVGRPRIKRVVLTNLVGLRVFELDRSEQLHELYRVNLRDLVLLPEEQATTIGSAESLVRFVDDFSRRELSSQEKLERVRAAPPWEPLFEVTSSRWIISRLDRVTGLLQHEVLDRIDAIVDPTQVTPDEQTSILDELHLLGSRVAEGLDEVQIDDFLRSSGRSAGRVVLEQYAMHVAYYTATRLLLVRIWEDLGLLEPMLFDGGLDEQLRRFDDAIAEVVESSFRQASDVYRSLFQHSSNYSWFVPSEDVYCNVIYELAFTYLGEIDSDILGQVYERLLARIDRKLLGQYYTPRDIIALIWNLIGFDEVASSTENEDRLPRVLDIATGSGGFLVEFVSRMRRRLAAHLGAGADLEPQEWLTEVAETTVGVEIQYFSRYLAELNLLVQMGQVVGEHPETRIAPIGVIAGDTLSLHEPVGQAEFSVPPTDQPERARKLKSVAESGFAVDVACGNPPYIGEKLAAPLLQRTRRDYPYWESFVAEHLDYLYWFLILGISKLASGGRFGFITTEYWLRASGARPLRQYIATNCEVDRIVLFRDLRLFPDAPGQHSMIVTGTRCTSPSGQGDDPQEVRPRVSLYLGPNLPDPHARASVLEAIETESKAARTTTFRSQVSPNALGGDSWGDVVLTLRQLKQRSRLRRGDQVAIRISKGVETTLNALTAKTAPGLTERALVELGWPDRKPGIQLLSPTEVDDLGVLNAAEDRVLRPVVNTRHVFPYAAVLPSDPDSVIYLKKPSDLDARTPIREAVTTPFPDGLPSIERHLERFQAILEKATEDRGERRPWWTLHRPRFDVIGEGGVDRWEPYCLTTRWGGGSRLIVGIAPSGSSPASGLHILRPVSPGVPPSYLAALYNSSVYQAIVDSLPPGNVRAEELLRIGTPLLSEDIDYLVEAGLELADLVETMVDIDAQRFRDLPETLRADVTLKAPPTGAWTPPDLPGARRGQLSDVAWVRDVDVIRGRRQQIGTVDARDTLFGRTVEVSSKQTDETAVNIELIHEVEPEAVSALVALLAGAAGDRVKANDVSSILVPVEAQELAERYASDLTALENRVARYRELRDGIDRLLEARLT